MKKHINVTQRDIDEGIPCFASFCPIARAINRHLDSQKVQVGVDTRDAVFLDLEMGWTLSVVDLPKTAVLFISAYDNDLSPKPFSFTLDLPDDLLKHRN